MSIQNRSKIAAAIANPRVLGGNPVHLNLINFTMDVSNDVNYINYMGTGIPTYYKGSKVAAYDMKSIEHTFTPSARIQTQAYENKGGINALQEEGNSDLTIPADDPEVAFISGEDLVFSGADYGQSIHIGATGLVPNSPVYNDEFPILYVYDGTEFVEVTENYDVDYHRGKITIPEGSSLDLSASYKIDYLCLNTPRNIAYSLSKIPRIGAEAVYMFDIEDRVGKENKGMVYPVMMDDINIDLSPGKPAEIEVGMDMRVGYLGTG